MNWDNLDKRAEHEKDRQDRIVKGKHPRWDGAVVLSAGGWSGDQFVVDSDRVQGYIDSKDDWIVKPFRYIED